MDLAVDVREEVDGHTGPDALFVAEEEDVFELGQAIAVHREDDLVEMVPGDPHWRLRLPTSLSHPTRGYAR